MRRKEKKLVKVFVIACALMLAALASGCARLFKRGAAQAEIMNVSQPLRVSLENTDAAEPAAAVGRDGTAFVAWVEHRPRKEADVLLARVSREGQLESAPGRVNQTAGSATAWRGDPPTVAVAPDGSVYVGWTQRAAPEGHATDLYLSASHDGGRTFETATKVNDDGKLVAHGMHALAVSGDGRIYVSWLDDRNQSEADADPATHKQMQGMERNREVFTAFSTDGGRSFSRNLRVAAEACPCCKTSLAVGPDGRAYVGWRQVLPGDYRHIAVASTADGGKTFREPVIVSNDQWVIAGCPVSGPSLHVAEDGVLRVMWYTAGERGTPGLYFAESRDGAHTFSESRLFAAGQATGNPQLLAQGSNGLFAVWGNSDGGRPRLMAARLAVEGKGQAIVSDGAELPSAVAAGDQLFVGYITSANDRRTIWVVRAKPVA